MARLARALAGNWRTIEVVQNGKPVPAGKGRRGTMHARLASGGNVLIVEGHAAGAVDGELGYYSAFWWDPVISRYRILTCFSLADNGGCTLRGTVHWEDATLVNEYADTVGGIAHDPYAMIATASRTRIVMASAARDRMPSRLSS